MPWSAACITNTFESEFSVHTGLSRWLSATKLPVLDKWEKSTLPRKECTMRAPETPAQSAAPSILLIDRNPTGAPLASVAISSLEMEHETNYFNSLRGPTFST